MVVIVGLALVASACSLPGVVSGSREVTAVFDDVGDLVVGHSVQLADVRIGSVVGIELLDDYRAEVTMSLADDVTIPADSQAVLRSTSLLGEKFVELRPPPDRSGPVIDELADGDRIAHTSTAPELEFVTEQAVQVLGAVVSSDLATIVDTTADAFGGRGQQLRELVEQLSDASATLAEQSDELVRIIDGLGGAAATFADGDDDVDAALRRVAEATTVLADNRDLAVGSLEQLTALAREQNEQIFGPHLQELDRQVSQVDAILAEVGRNQHQLVELVTWLERFSVKLPSALPNDFVQVFGLLSPEPTS